MNSEFHEEFAADDGVPVVQVIDDNVYVTSNKIIAHIIIKSFQGEQRRPLVRTKNGKYMMQ